MTVDAKLEELKVRLREVSDLSAAGSVLGWDQATYMPPGGAAARARQGATLSRLAHEKFTDPALGKLLDQLQPYAGSLPADSDDASLIRITRRDFEKAVKVPADFVAHWSAHSSSSYDAWTRARPGNDFATMRPLLERSLDFSRQYAGFFAPYAHIADPLIDGPDEGMTSATVLALFTDLRAGLVPIVRAIAEQPIADDSCLRGAFPEAAQMAFGTAVIERVGYDMARGRLDKTHHPFCTKFAAGDVRITTRVRENDIAEALFSTLHEAGHALYEQGVDVAFEGTPLNSGASAGVHESQSRLWENVVGRSRGFWEHFYPRLRDTFPDQFARVPLETFYRAINKVQRSLIRTDADEVTYNLHIMMRFDLELALLEGRLAVKDLPEAWRARFAADFGIIPPDDRDGCLQDVHWYAGAVGGGFQGYTIGNILGAQFYDAALRAHPEIPAQMASGEFATLREWLRVHLYRHGRKFTPDQLVERATGGPMTIAPYIAYLRAKYGELYRLP
jgi:carboxypeptidase Taq